MPRKLTAKQRAKRDTARIEAIFYKQCSGVQIPVLKLASVFNAGQAAIDAGADDAALAVAICEAAELVRSN